MKTVNDIPITAETLFHGLTGEYNFKLSTEKQLKQALTKAGKNITLLTREESKADTQAEYADVILIDRTRLENYHKYVKIPPEETKIFIKRITEI